MVAFDNTKPETYLMVDNAVKESASPEESDALRAVKTDEMRGKLKNITINKVQRPKVSGKNIQEVDAVELQRSEPTNFFFVLAAFSSLMWVSYVLGYGVKHGLFTSFAPQDLMPVGLQLFAVPAMVCAVVFLLQKVRNAKQNNLLAYSPDVDMGKIEEFKVSMRKAMDDVAPDLVQLMAGLSEAQENILQFKASFADVREGISRDISDATGVFDEKLERIRGNADSVCDDVLSSAQTLDQIAQSLNAHDVTKDIQDALESFEKTAESFSDKMLDVKDISKIAGEDIVRCMKDVSLEAQALEDIAVERTKKSNAIIQNIQDEAENIIQKTAVNFSALQKIQQDLSEQSVLSNEVLEEGIEAVNELCDRIKKQSEDIETYIDFSIGKMKSAAKDINQSAESISESSIQAADDLERAQTEISSRAAQFEQVCELIEQSSSKCTEKFEQQCEKLFEAFQSVESSVVQSVEDLRLGENSVARRRFLETAKFVLEGLHSAAVDITRADEGHIDGDMWREFQQGDVSVFTRKLLQASGLHHESAQEKFKKDPDFRTYVLRYIRQFETLYNDISGGDDSDALLATSLGTSDVAKLYQYLCEVSGKDAIFKG